MELSPGILLLSDPFLKDPNFIRSVVLVCESNPEGAFGLVLNRKIEYVLGDLVEQALGVDVPVFEGGPVQPTALHFIHRKGNLIPNGVEITSGIFWGGDFDVALELLRSKALSPGDIRFFVGYSGWSAGQLEAEVEEKSWILAEARPGIVFDAPEDQIWSKSLHTLGGEYAQMSNYPIDPQLN
ncbi:MAG TPA: YqgE/AlgH family protein [Sediminibacterium sp.]|nr:YqgE/AlgH family protein [Sediminibacterium sp.]